MKAILKTTDPVLLTYARHLLEEADIPHFVFDENMAFTEGNIGAFPRRLMVREEDAPRARTALAELAGHLLPEDDG